MVRRLGAVQAQDYGSALWAVGLRMKAVPAPASMPGSVPVSVQTIEQAIHDRKLVRTWPMRGTLHFVAADDVRWMLALLAPRIIARSARRHTQLELDDATFARAEALFGSALQGGQRLTRSEMMAVLERDGIATTGQRGYHILWWAAQQGLICSGPRQGKEDTFVWLDDWLPPVKTRSRDEALAEVAYRYFSGHGPATLQDFMWWTGLAAADARSALEMVQSRLVPEEIDGQTYWQAQDASRTAPPLQTPTVHLLPSFDEYLLGYRERAAVLDPAHAGKVVPGGNGVFRPLIVMNGQIVGTWKRTLRKTKVIINFMPFIPDYPLPLELLAVAAEAYGRFLNLPVEISA